MIAGVVAAFYLAGIILAVEAAMTVRTARGAVAWPVSLVSFPFVAVPAVDEEFARDMEAMFETDFAHADPIDPESLENRPFWWRVGVSLSRLAAPVL